jgi:alkanesulfonate monooxygenase SsuD/methylene tetrahydromethanopterin reductase-like flavin-dependent oxidoreductase (luciferase family)
MIKTADELGYYACYAADETWHKDLWLVFAAAADKTQSIRFGPNVSGVYLREPTLICQSLGTLDELTGGRVDGVISCGNFGLLSQYGVDWKSIKAFSRVKEAHHVMRTFLDEGAITYEGEFYRYSGLFTFARPVQERLPVKIGAMRGPKSFELAGEIADCMHQALAYSREAMQYATDHVRIGAERAGRDWRELDLGAWMISSISEDGQAAREAARVVAAFYLPSMPREQIERHGIDPDSLQPALQAFGRGDVEGALAATPPELADRLSLSGTPEEWIERIEQDVVPSGFNHLVFAPIDPFLVRAWSGVEVEGVPDQVSQLRLIHERVMPAFA